MYYYIIAFVFVIINVTLFLSLWTIISIFLISVISQAGCYEIESNIVNSGMCLVARRIRKKGENKNIK